MQELECGIAPNISGMKTKSARGSSYEVGVKHKITWPQNFIFVCGSRKRLTYDNLHQTQWTCGVLNSIMEEQNLEIRSNILGYFVDLMQDDTDLGGKQPKAVTPLYYGN